MILTARINVGSGNLSRRIDAFGHGLGRAREIEGCDVTIASTQETMSLAVHIKVKPRNLPCWVDSKGLGEDRVRRIEGRDSAVASTQEAVVTVRVVIPRNLPSGVDG